MPKVDIDFIGIYRRTGIGKSTLAVAMGIQYSVDHNGAPIVSNIPIHAPGIETKTVTKVVDLLNPNCPLALKTGPCTCTPSVLIIDEFDKSFSSAVGYVKIEREKMLRELVSNLRKHGHIAFIFTSQGRKKINNLARQNCKYVLEPTGTLDLRGCPEYFLWDDTELYDEKGKARYADAFFMAVDIPLSVLEPLFNTREIVPIEWD